MVPVDLSFLEIKREPRTIEGCSERGVEEFDIEEKKRGQANGIGNCTGSGALNNLIGLLELV